MRHGPRLATDPGIRLRGGGVEVPRIPSDSVYHGRGVTLPRPAILILYAGLAGAAAAVAALAARSTWHAPALVLAITIVVLPALVLLAAVRPAAALGVFVAGQVLEAFEYSTAVGTISFGVILLGLLLLFHWRYVWDRIRSDRDLVIATILLGGWVATYAFRLRYEPASTAAREVVTVLSFGAYAAAGIAVARCRHVIRNVGIGATAALLILGICGVLASVGAIPAPSRIDAARDFLWFSNPIRRNYGLNVTFDAVALLVPLSVSWLLVSFMSSRGRGRIAAAGTLIALVFLMLFVFQAREMIVQLMVAVVAAACVVRPKVGWIATAVALPIVVLGVIHLVALDKTSSDVRLVPDRYVFTVLAHDPQRFLLGTSESGFFNESIRSSPSLVAATQTGDYSVHNFFLSNLVAGGVAAFAFTVLLFALILRRAWRLWRSAPSDSDSRVLLIACVVVLVTLLMETVQQNAAGYWVLVGLVLGFPLVRRAGAEAEERPELVASYTHPPPVPASAWVGVPSRVAESARRHRVAVAVPLLLVPTIAIALALSNAPTRSEVGHVTFTELPLERQYVGDRPLVLRTDDVRSGLVSLTVDSSGPSTSVTARATAERPRDAAARVNAYLDAYSAWHERAASARLSAAIERLQARIAALHAPRDAEKRQALTGKLDQMERLSYLPIGQPTTLERVELPPRGWSIVAELALALALGLFLGLGAAVAADALSVRYREIGDPITPDGSVAAQ